MSHQKNTSEDFPAQDRPVSLRVCMTGSAAGPSGTNSTPPRLVVALPRQLLPSPAPERISVALNSAHRLIVNLRHGQQNALIDGQRSTAAQLSYVADARPLGIAWSADGAAAAADDSPAWQCQVIPFLSNGGLLVSKKRFSLERHQRQRSDALVPAAPPAPPATEEGGRLAAGLAHWLQTARRAGYSLLCTEDGFFRIASSSPAA